MWPDGSVAGAVQEDQQDSQLINSVYLDNSSMELYHGRLDKRPNAIAVRIRSAPLPGGRASALCMDRYSACLSAGQCAEESAVEH